MARKKDKSKTSTELDRTKALQDGLQHLMDEARQIRAMVEKLSDRDDAREVTRLLKRRSREEAWADDSPATRGPRTRRPN
ncbi:MAG: hypothetical protein DMF86_08730 [Acidobacteria bacterium]|nr:MAG: hypothetical protein DMF86_08730 [Acidobacteriota bacterium]